MPKRPSDLGERRHERIYLRKEAFVFFEPTAPWFECTLLDISEGGVRLDVGALPVPDIFGLSLSNTGTVLRICRTAWRRGGILGARFTTAKQIREEFGCAPPTLAEAAV